MKIGDIVRITDGSYSRIICGKVLVYYCGSNFKKELWRVVSVNVSLPVEGVYNVEILNVLVQGESSGIVAFVLQESCKLHFPERDIVTKYFCDGEDVTDKLSDETKRNLASINR